jgi:hypothetical protein
MNDGAGFAQLLDWLEGRLSAPDAEQVATQVTVSEALGAEVAWIRTFHTISRDVVWEAPPAGFREQLSRRFAAHVAENRPPSLWQRLTAALKFDSLRRPAAIGVRAGAPQSERQLVYSTDYADIALTIQSPASAGRFSLFGQILPTIVELDSAYSIELLEGGQELDFAVATEVGDFVFEVIPHGEYELVIRSDQYEIVIPLHLE